MSTSEREKLCNVEAEHALCGAILIDPDVMLKLVGTVGPGDFTNEKARWVFEAASTLYEQQQPIDQLTICDALAQANKLDAVGGAAFLSKLIYETPTSLHVERYAEILTGLATKRALMEVALGIAKLVHNANGASTAEITEQVRAMIDAATPTKSTEDTLLWEDSIRRFVEVQRVRADRAEHPEQYAQAALSFPWTQTFERFKLKIRPGTVALVVAGSSVGKTTFMECCAEFWAAQGYNVLYFHAELQHQGMLDRRTCRLADVDLEVVESRMSNEAIDRALAQMNSYRGRIVYQHCPGWSARQVVAKAREMHAKGLCDVMIVDYLQKLRLWMPKGYNKQDGLADAAEVVKNCAEQLHIYALEGSQINRRDGESGRLTGMNVRGSGEIDEKGNITIFLTREILMADMNNGQYKAGELSPIMDVRIGKNTYGKTGECKLFIRGDRYLIAEMRQEKGSVPW